MKMFANKQNPIDFIEREILAQRLVSRKSRPGIPSAMKIIHYPGEYVHP